MASAGVIAGLILAVVGTAPGRAAAGGWAVVSYGPLGELVAGAPAAVTFQVLSHGVQPVAAGDFPGVGLELEVIGPEGSAVYPAAPADLVGHYAATIDVPVGSDEIGLAVQWDDGMALQQTAITVPVVATPAGAGSDWAPFASAALGLAGAALLVSARPPRAPLRRGAAAGDQSAAEPVSV